MATWKYCTATKEVTNEQIDEILGSLVCFKCGKELHSENCPFAKLRAELKALKEE